MKKIILSLLGILLAVNLLSLTSAADVAYVSLTPDYVEQEFIAVLNELSFSYDLVYHNQISSYDFSTVKLVLINNNFFTNWDEIPVNDIPSLIVNGRNIDDWGWTTMVSSSSQSIPMHINLDTSHEITEGLDEDIQIYTTNEPDIYYLDKTDIYSGLQIVGSNVYDNQDAVVAIATEGTILTKPGYPDTHINADSIFFGITEAEYWTNDARQLFKNSLVWLHSEDLTAFDINLVEGQNLISLPLILDTNNAEEILILNPEVISVKEYLNNGIIETSTINNNQGYFLESTADSILTIEGIEASSTQNVELNQGMNLVGITSLIDIDLDSLPDEIIEVARRNEDGTYDISTKYFFGWHNEFSLEPGKGYWFKTNEEVVWSYEST
ncbi:MAG: hypothetical protein KJ718_00205 [Nanoarchaeota archaeon]|nr:hypothetical protein [Nanoarchaeota archaeon]MBU1050962.1 hypothetical protein [Nanoarchaeota archaeon]